MLHIWIVLDQFDPNAGSPFQAWVGTVAVRHIRKTSRKMAEQTMLPLPEDFNVTNTDDIQTRLDIDDILHWLPTIVPDPVERQAFLEWMAENIIQEEAARRLGISQGEVSKRFKQYHEQLRQHLNDLDI